MKKIIRNFKSAGILSAAAAQYTAKLAKAEIEKKGYFTIALSGGKTVIPYYKQLAKEEIPWDKTYIFWQDDRFVKYSHKDSNVKLVFDCLISKAKIPFDKVYPVPGPENTAPAEQAARAYEMIIKQLFKHLQPGSKVPSLDLIVAGMGNDGHTASLFPGDKKALAEKKKLITSVLAPPYAVIKDRITMTLPFMNASKNVLFLTENKDRKEVLRQVLKGNKKYPAALVKPKQNLIWMIS